MPSDSSCVNGALRERLGARGWHHHFTTHFLFSSRATPNLAVRRHFSRKEGGSPLGWETLFEVGAFRQLPKHFEDVEGSQTEWFSNDREGLQKGLNFLSPRWEVFENGTRQEPSKFGVA